MSQLIVFQPDRLRKRAIRKPVAGAGNGENQHQAPRIVRQFLMGSEPGAVAQRERVPRQMVTRIIRERLAEHEFGRAA